ncbi:hypothetical protein [Undibacterium danionis]|uniref:Uncharacterized protein n=1 Tax=Undibacterium danionis TaxID=1812100 RepID=A0ABV6IFT6_9BURK
MRLLDVQAQKLCLYIYLGSSGYLLLDEVPPALYLVTSDASANRTKRVSIRSSILNGM